MRLFFIRIFVPAACLLSWVIQPARSETQEIDGVGLSRDLHCHGDDINIYGAQNVITLTGTCANITIQGSNHTISFEKGARLVVMGIRQKISGGEANGLSIDGANTEVGVTLRPAEGEAFVDIAGAEHKVKLRLDGPSRLQAQGYKHDIAWALSEGATKPRISASGIQSRISQVK